MFEEESNIKVSMNKDSKKKPAQLKKKVQEGTMEEKCVAEPVLTRTQAKKSDKIHPLKVKEAVLLSLGKTSNSS